MPLGLGLKHKVNINDRDLGVVERIALRFCQSIDGVAKSIRDVAKSANRVATVIENKKMRLE